MYVTEPREDDSVLRAMGKHEAQELPSRSGTYFVSISENVIVLLESPEICLNERGRRCIDKQYSNPARIVCRAPSPLSTNDRLFGEGRSTPGYLASLLDALTLYVRHAGSPPLLQSVRKRAVLFYLYFPRAVSRMKAAWALLNRVIKSVGFDGASRHSQQWWTDQERP